MVSVAANSMSGILCEPCLSVLGLQALPGFDIVGYFGERAVQCRAKLVFSTSGKKVFNAFMHSSATLDTTELLELALHRYYTTPHGSTSVLLRQAIRERAAAPRYNISRLRQMVLDDELWFGWMTETGTIFAASDCEAVARTFYDGTVAFSQRSGVTSNLLQLYGCDADFMYRTRFAFHETHYAAWRFKTVEQRAVLDAHRAAPNTRRSGGKDKLKDPALKIFSHYTAEFSADVVYPVIDGACDLTARPQFVAFVEPNVNAFLVQTVSALTLLGMQSLLQSRTKRAIGAAIAAEDVGDKRRRVAPPQQRSAALPALAQLAVSAAPPPALAEPAVSAASPPALAEAAVLAASPPALADAADLVMPALAAVKPAAAEIDTQAPAAEQAVVGTAEKVATLLPPLENVLSIDCRGTSIEWSADLPSTDAANVKEALRLTYSFLQQVGASSCLNI